MQNTTAPVESVSRFAGKIWQRIAFTLLTNGNCSDRVEMENFDIFVSFCIFARSEYLDFCFVFLSHNSTTTDTHLTLTRERECAECKLRLNKQFYIFFLRRKFSKLAPRFFDNPGSNFKTLGCQNFVPKTKFNPLAFSNTAL